MTHRTPDLSCFLLQLYDQGTETALAGEQLRAGVIAYQEETRSRVILDFEGVEQVSAAFADELIGKLVIHYGFFGFNQVIALRGMNTAVQQSVQQAVTHRLLADLE